MGGITAARDTGGRKAFCPFMWAAGHLADRIGRKPPIVAGMLIHAAGLAVIAAGIAPRWPPG